MISEQQRARALLYVSNGKALALVAMKRLFRHLPGLLSPRAEAVMCGEDFKQLSVLGVTKLGITPTATRVSLRVLRQPA